MRSSVVTGIDLPISGDNLVIELTILEKYLNNCFSKLLNNLVLLFLCVLIRSLRVLLVSPHTVNGAGLALYSSLSSNPPFFFPFFLPFFLRYSTTSSRMTLFNLLNNTSSAHKNSYNSFPVRAFCFLVTDLIIFSLRSETPVAF